MPALILKQPQAVFGLPSRDPRVLSDFDRYLSQVAAALAQCSWDKNILEMLDLLPQVFLRLDDSVELDLNSLHVLYRHMYVVLKAYQQHGNPQLEEILQLSPEYSFHLLHWLRAHPDRKTANPIEAFKQALLPDPFWAIQWQRLQPDPAYYARILDFVHGSRELNARSAWAWHQMQAPRMTRAAALAELNRSMPLLLTDPPLCFNVLDVYPELDPKVLFRSAFRHPDWMLAWACRFPGEFDQVVQRELLRQPAWLVEYTVRCKPTNARELLTGARERCRNDWLAPWLDLYINRNQ